MPGKRKIGNLLSRYRSVLKKDWRRNVLCFLVVLGFFGSVSVAKSQVYEVNSDTNWYKYCELENGYGGSRVLLAGDTLKIHNGATLSFDFTGDENEDMVDGAGAVIAMTIDYINVDIPVSGDVSITGGTIVGISHAPPLIPIPLSIMRVGLVSTVTRITPLQ